LSPLMECKAIQYRESLRQSSLHVLIGFAFWAGWDIYWIGAVCK
jgi:hypothetical protein